MTEEWKQVQGYENNYEVSNTGIVRSLKTGKTLRHSISKGYHRVSMYRNSKRKTYMVHRIVAQAFLDVPATNRDQINHIDGNKDNNTVWNLEWCTQSENMAHSFRIGLREHNKKMLLLANSKQVIQLNNNGDIVKKWNSMSDAARALELDVSNICNCCKGVIKSTGGFVWKKAYDY